MKKSKTRSTVFVTLAIVILAVVFMLTNKATKQAVDRYSPFLTKEYVYVKIDQPGVLSNHRFEYELTGYNSEGRKEKVSFTASTELTKGTYLKVLAKGSYAEKYEMIKAEEIPPAIKW
jgi:uncharacterized protein (TIGR01655 family)